MFMDEVNTVSIPSLRLNSNFLNTAEGGIGNSDFVYYTHANRSILTGDMNLEKMNEGEAIYLNTNAGLVSYRVEVSEFSVSDGTDIIGQTSGTSIWDAQYENDLCLYALMKAATGWLSHLFLKQNPKTQSTLFGVCSFFVYNTAP